MMKKKTIVIIAVASSAFLLLLFAPWITYDYAISRVVEKLGGPEARYIYLGEDMAVKDIPKQVSWFPFGRFVAFPGEAGWIVTFYGSVIF